MATIDKTKVAIVTGSSRGIGASIAKRLAADGLAVVVNYVGNHSAAKEVVDAVLSNEGKAIAIKGDISIPAEVTALFDQTISAFGGVDVLVNSAGVMQSGLVPIKDTDDALFERLIGVNIKGTFCTMREAASKLRSGGRVINLASSVRKLALPGYGVYAATKAAVESLTLIFAKEMRGRNITVNAVAPGPTETELFFNGKSKEQVEHLTKLPPLERLGKPEDIANIISFLASNEAEWVNGQTIFANGGFA